MRLRWIVIGAFAAGSGPACGGGEEANDTTSASGGAAAATAATAATQNACTLLPASEVTAVIGESARDSLALSMPGAGGEVSLSQCNYATVSNPAAVSLMLRRSAAAETVVSVLQGVRETFTQSGVTGEEVPGLGDGAIWGGNQLHVVTTRGWSIVVTPTVAGGLAQARTLAERALSRI